MSGGGFGKSMAVGQTCWSSFIEQLWAADHKENPDFFSKISLSVFKWSRSGLPPVCYIYWTFAMSFMMAIGGWVMKELSLFSSTGSYGSWAMLDV